MYSLLLVESDGIIYLEAIINGHLKNLVLFCKNSSIKCESNFYKERRLQGLCKYLSLCSKHCQTLHTCLVSGAARSSQGPGPASSCVDPVHSALLRSWTMNQGENESYNSPTRTLRQGCKLILKLPLILKCLWSQNKRHYLLPRPAPPTVVMRPSHLCQWPGGALAGGCRRPGASRWWCVARIRDPCSQGAQSQTHRRRCHHRASHLKGITQLVPVLVLVQVPVLVLGVRIFSLSLHCLQNNDGGGSSGGAAT